METFIVEYTEDLIVSLTISTRTCRSRPYDPMLTPADLLTESTDLGQDVVCELENDVGVHGAARLVGRRDDVSARTWTFPTVGVGARAT